MSRQQYLNQIITGVSRELVRVLPDNFIDLFFTDPPTSRNISRSMVGSRKRQRGC
jgi:DNA modification methylase